MTASLDSRRAPRGTRAPATAILAAALAAGAGGTTAHAKPAGEEQRVAEAVERALQKHGPDVHRCFEKALADSLDVSGKVEVEVEVGGAGRVSGVKVVSQGAEVPPELAACVKTAAAGWTIEDVEPGASVVLPFHFEGQTGQFVIKASDVPKRGPMAAKAHGGKAAAPFTVQVLADPVNVHSMQAALTLLAIGPASRVAMHRHPRSAKILYLLKGRARVLGPAGAAPIKAGEGTAIFLPPGYPHVIENMGRSAEAVFLQVFSPPGPERVYRDPRNPEARADFEVIHDPRRARAPAGAKPHVADREQVHATPLHGSKATARVLIDEKGTGSNAMSLSVVEYAPGFELARHDHPGASEIDFVLSGAGKVTVGRESMGFGPETAIYIPGDQPHALHFGAGGPTTLVQIYAPAGPEQRAHASNGLPTGPVREGTR